MSINQPCCDSCGHADLEVLSHYETRQRFICCHCRRVFSETRGTLSEGLRKPVSIIALALTSRSEGGRLNSTGRVFDIAKNILLEWARRFSNLKNILLIYRHPSYLAKSSGQFNGQKNIRAQNILQNCLTFLKIT